MFTNHLTSPAHSACKLAVLIPLTLALWAAPHRSLAQGASDEMSPFGQRQDSLHSPFTVRRGAADNSALGRQFLGFFNTGGYVLTGNGKSSALFGSPKFYNNVTFYSHAKRVGGFEIAGGAETMLLSDHFVPFTGGNEYDLLGGSASISTPRALHQPRLYVSGGLFYGRLRSVNQGFDHSQFIPSGAIGVEYPLSAYFSLDATYRVSQNIKGINTDGFSFSLRIH